MNYSNQICCPKCGSNQISAHKKGFSGKKAVAGAVLTGGIGLLAGTIGSNKILITCLNCANQFKPGDRPVQKTTQSSIDKEGNILGIIVIVIAIILVVVAVKLNNNTPAGHNNSIYENNAKIIDTASTPVANKPTHSVNLKYTIISSRRGTDDLIKNMFVYIPTLKNIEKINDELITSYRSTDATDFQIYYFNNKKVAATYESSSFDSNVSNQESDRMSRHVIAKYEYSSITYIDHLYTGSHSDNN